MSFGSTPQVNYQPSGVTSSTGLNVSPYGNYSESPQLSSNVNALANQYGQAAGAVGNLAQTVAPGFSQARTAGLADIASQYQQAQSNLQGSLAQRRILGSSFANNQQSNLSAQQAQDTANFEANSYFQETQAYNTLMQEQYQYSTAQYQTYISQSNIEAGLASSLTQSNNQIAAQIATSNANLQAQSQAGVGKLVGAGVGTALAVGLAPLTGGASLAAIPGIAAGGFGVSAPSYGSSNAPAIFQNPLAGLFGSNPALGSGSAATIYPDPNNPGGYAPGYA